MRAAVSVVANIDSRSSKPVVTETATREKANAGDVTLRKEVPSLASVAFS